MENEEQQPPRKEENHEGVASWKKGSQGEGIDWVKY